MHPWRGLALVCLAGVIWGTIGPGVALVDGVGERRAQNQPGTDGDQYPNWCIPLADDELRPVLVEDLPSNARFASLVAALEDAGVGGGSREDDDFLR